MLTLGFAKIISVKKPEGKKRDFFRFSITSKTVTFVLVASKRVEHFTIQIRKGIFQKALTFLHLLDIPI